MLNLEPSPLDWTVTVVELPLSPETMLQCVWSELATWALGNFCL
jgi:hypothetical protein